MSRTYQNGYRPKSKGSKKKRSIHVSIDKGLNVKSVKIKLKGKS